MRGQRPRFEPGRALTLQAFAAVAVVLSLAAWQFSRGLEKTALATDRTERLRASPLAVADVAAAPADIASAPDFTRVSLRGTYDPMRAFFVSDRPGAGAEAWSVLRTPDADFLVNRGRVAGLDPAPRGEVAAIGVIMPARAVSGYVANQPWPQGWPKAIRWADPLRMAEAADAYPRELRLEAGSAGVERPASLAWDYSPGTHWGYTAQWLAIGAAVVAGYVVIGLRRGRRHHG